MNDSLQGKAWEFARRRLSEERLRHTEGTAEAAARLAALLGADPGKAVLAAVLHDIARDLSPEDLLRAARSKGIMVRTVDTRNPVLLHGKIAAAEAEALGVRDPDVLQAIASHVTGRRGWTGLEKAVYLADKVESTRSYPGVDRLRELIDAGQVEVALMEALRGAVAYAAKYGPGLVDPETVVVLNEVSQDLSQSRER